MEAAAAAAPTRASSTASPRSTRRRPTSSSGSGPTGAGRSSGCCGGLRPKDGRRALAHLLVLTSFETFEELRRRAGLSEREVVRTLQESVRTLLRS